MKEFQKKVNFFENAYDPSSLLSRQNQQIITINLKIDEFES